ncbi:hypothetical protein H0H87_002502, partial [Tephrocybe sp. NHM501043]
MTIDVLFTIKEPTFEIGMALSMFYVEFMLMDMLSALMITEFRCNGPSNQPPFKEQSFIDGDAADRANPQASAS